MSGCEYHVGQFDRPCCSGKGWLKLEGGTLDWGDDSPCAHTETPCTKCGKELLPSFEETFTMTNYLYQGAIAVEAMEEFLSENEEYREEWEAWDWL